MVSGLFEKPSMPAIPEKDPFLEKQEREARERAEAQIEKDKKMKLADEEGRKKGLRGAKALLGGGMTGFKDTLGA